MSCMSPQDLSAHQSMLHCNEKVQRGNGKSGAIEVDPKSRSKNSLRPFQQDLF